MNATPATLVRQIDTARRINRVSPNRVVYRTVTGQMPSDLRTGQMLVQVKPCEDVKKYGEHVLTHVEADLPGDRSVGRCSCGEWIDTGTWDERNA